MLTKYLVRVPGPPWLLAVVAIFAIQLTSALSVPLIELVGPGGTAWLRLSMGALLMLALVPPPLRSLRRGDAPVLLGLGIGMGLTTVAFLAAIERIPLGTAVAIEFLGPLTVAAVRSGSLRTTVWPVLALGGVVLLTEPWHSEFDVVGVGFALLAGIGWGTYIVLLQKVGDRFTGAGVLSATLPVAAVTAGVIGWPQAAGHIDGRVLLIALGLALLAPVAQFVLELAALRRMTATAFGTLMALEPAAALILGLVILAQLPSALQYVGIMLVVVAGACAQRGGLRAPPLTTGPVPLPEPRRPTD
ncbi:EamA family transporter [Nesterenkonia sphaerica]|uniref:EamA family transporter n=1 Tax=Nesterenkonia sphaerica TaxID=1804988 RepID=A0A5R9AKX4_9MICC|nr:EamA family transporter [Nesterenkonia sphaerica]TLP79449.1 EamA family transporter [Nesterenkonia sphaerica]